MTKAQAFVDKHGPKTIVLARFVPIVRTFAPIVAGVGKMKYRTFVIYNLVGGALWGIGVTTLGYFLGEIEFVKNNIEIAILAVVAISLLPVVIEVLRHRRQVVGGRRRHRRGHRGTRRGAPRPRLSSCRSLVRQVNRPTKSMRRSTAPTSSGRRSA